MPTIYEFPDNSNRLFGRRPDLQYLLERTRRRGVTAILGPPQMGKSWLLKEVGRLLIAEQLQRGLNTPGGLNLRAEAPLLGWVPIPSRLPETIPRAVKDLYVRWRETARSWDKAAIYMDLKREGITPQVIETLGSLLGGAAALQGPHGAALGGIVKTVTLQAATLERELSSGGVEATRQIDLSRLLLEVLYKRTNRPMVLVLDQWEKADATELTSLEEFVRTIDSWPPCHVVLATVQDTRSKSLEVLEHMPGGVFATHLLKPMHIEDADERERLLGYVRADVPYSEQLTDEEIIGQIGGLPAVLSRWLDSSERRRFRSRADLIQQAQLAVTYSYPEFEVLFAGSTYEEKSLAMRLLMLPSPIDPDDWDSLQQVVLGDTPELLDRLARSGMLEDTSPPSFGHNKRAAAASEWVFAKESKQLSKVAEAFVRAVAGLVPRIEDGIAPALFTLVSMSNVAKELKLSKLAQAACESASSLLSKKDVNASRLLGASEELGDAKMAPLLSLGLLQAFYCHEQDTQMRKLLLEELRALSAKYPVDEVVREYKVEVEMGEVAKDFDKELPNGLIKDLRILVYADPASVRFRLRFALMLQKSIADSVDKTEDGWREEWESSLDELRALWTLVPEDTRILHAYADSLMRIYVAEKMSLHHRSETATGTELETLIQRFPEDPVLNLEIQPFFVSLNS